ncbi:uncharacterized protein BO88DRAFT_428822 [Aspergillus vadensis CBS 113365]|uniref:Uncharacterized protein n=1 Tax=Aspergillus vadensis (strain CBS 113365 / IMI 142717 / IBT 24658) TaxID=1448311 RepID=A0A319BPK7_ASPVC|nr:hypothetical protein BO88DRAFT_428822 [Aspergillus vadensis CBS 113365]PYH65138.1 hypothetical protein BO88DRAFT_428822 [Aspergillus vadensis CBS 113365]
MAMTCLAECPTKMAKQGCEDASLTDRPGREEVGTAGKEAAAATEDEDVVVGGQRWLLFGEIWRTRSSFPPTSSPGCGYDSMEKQLEAYRKQRSIRQRTAKRGGTDRKSKKKEEVRREKGEERKRERVRKRRNRRQEEGGETGGERIRILSTPGTDDLVRTDGHESSIARPVEILQLDEFMSQSRRRWTVGFCFIEWSSVGNPENERVWAHRINTARTRRYEPRIRNPALSNRQSRRRATRWAGWRRPFPRGPSWTVHITEEARPRKEWWVVSGEAPGTAASGAPQRGAPIGYFFPKSSADGPRAATLGDVNHSMLPRPFVW